MEYTKNNYTIQGKITSDLILEFVNKIKNNNLDNVCEIYKNLLELVFLTFYKDLIENHVFVNESIISEKIIFKKILLILLVYIRDIKDGLGKYNLYYQLIGVYCKTLDKIKKMENNKFFVYKYDYMLSYLKNIIYFSVIKSNNTNELPYGSWKDIKYLLNHLRDIYGEKELINKDIFKYIMELLCCQLKNEIAGICQFSLLAKWLPREKSKKFGWQNKYIAISFATNRYDLKNYIKENIHSKNELNIYYLNLRKMVVYINKILQTPQIYQCSNNWSLINFDNVSKTTIKKQKNAFEYKNKIKANQIDNDRLICKEKFINFNKKINNKKIINKNNIILDWKNLLDILLNSKYKYIEIL
tara:strand:- start:9815 stop:10885 length:1071 start_codon:yes stop_codon:yes gene_type:complete